MKKRISLVLVLSLLFTACSTNLALESSADEDINDKESVQTAEYESNYVGLRDSDYLNDEAEELKFSSMSDPDLLPYMEGAVYDQLIDKLGPEVYIENVSAVYISQEYIDELSYNSKANMFFGYTLQELDAQFQGTKYVFNVENGQTVVQPMAEYDDSYEKMIRNIAIGSGVILVCVTVSVVTYGAGAPAASMIFAAAAKTGAIMGLSSGAISGAAAGLTTGITTGDWDQALDDAAIAGSEGFMYGAICGTILGGSGEAIGLHGATLNGLSMNEAATIQRESRLPLKLIKEFQSMEQYGIIKDSGLYGGVINGNPAVIRDIDLNFVDDMGRTNLERMLAGEAPLDPTGTAYELHHLGQAQDSTLAILTQAEHRGAGNHAIWHNLVSPSNVDHGAMWTAQREAFWKSYAQLLLK